MVDHTITAGVEVELIDGMGRGSHSITRNLNRIQRNVQRTSADIGRNFRQTLGGLSSDLVKLGGAYLGISSANAVGNYRDGLRDVSRQLKINGADEEALNKRIHDRALEWGANLNAMIAYTNEMARSTKNLEDTLQAIDDGSALIATMRFNAQEAEILAGIQTRMPNLSSHQMMDLFAKMEQDGHFRGQDGLSLLNEISRLDGIDRSADNIEMLFALMNTLGDSKMVRSGSDAISSINSLYSDLMRDDFQTFYRGRFKQNYIEQVDKDGIVVNEIQDLTGILTLLYEDIKKGGGRYDAKGLGSGKLSDETVDLILTFGKNQDKYERYRSNRISGRQYAEDKKGDYKAALNRLETAATAFADQNLAVPVTKLAEMIGDIDNDTFERITNVLSDVALGLAVFKGGDFLNKLIGGRAISINPVHAAIAVAAGKMAIDWGFNKLNDDLDKKTNRMMSNQDVVSQELLKLSQMGFNTSEYREEVFDRIGSREFESDEQRIETIYALLNQMVAANADNYLKESIDQDQYKYVKKNATQRGDYINLSSGGRSRIIDPTQTVIDNIEAGRTFGVAPHELNILMKNMRKHRDDKNILETIQDKNREDLTSITNELSSILREGRDIKISIDVRSPHDLGVGLSSDSAIASVRHTKTGRMRDLV